MFCYLLTDVCDTGGDLVHSLCSGGLEDALQLHLVPLVETAKEDPDVLQEGPRPLHATDLKLVEQRSGRKFNRIEYVSACFGLTSRSVGVGLIL